MPSVDTEKEAWKNLDMTNEEAERFTQCFKEPEFRKLFMEYAEEIADPENRAKYEMEIKQLEADKGVDCDFIHPNPGYVLKTIVNGETKCFINIAENDKVGKPSSQMGVGEGGKKGMQWSIPHSLAPPRDDFDKEKKMCHVYDCVFHPDTLRMAKSNKAFKDMIDSTALDSIAEKFKVTLDRTNIKYPKMNYKGTPQAAVIRKASGQKPKENLDPLQAGAYPANWKMPGAEYQELKPTMAKNPSPQPEFTEPKYTVTHRRKSDIKDFAYLVDSSSTRPDELVVNIDVPLVKSANDINVDVDGDKLLLTTEPKAAKYKLDLKLPFPVLEDGGSAKFDKQKRQLTLVLPVQQKTKD